MAENKAEPLVVIAADFSDEMIEKIRDSVPHMRVERHFPQVPEQLWPEVEILYSIHTFPDPQAVPRLRWIQMHMSGVNRILSEPIAQSRDVTITTASGLHAGIIAEYSLMAMLAFSQKLLTMQEYQRKAEWPEARFEIFSRKPLRGQTLGIIGYGSIGRELARMADALGMIVLASKRDVMHPADHDHYREANMGDPEGEIPRRIYPPEATVSMVRECDFVVVLSPLTDKTNQNIGEEVFDAMKPTAYLINVARGEVVDEDALISALAAHKIAGAALDVFSEEPLPSTSPLWNLDNVIISPHIAGNREDYHDAVTDIFIENLRRYQENKPLLNLVKPDFGY